MANKSKKRRTVIIMLLSFFIVFAFTVYLIMPDSKYSDAKEKIGTCQTENCVFNVWNEYEASYSRKKSFRSLVRDKLMVMKLDADEEKKWIKLLPPESVSLNVIIITDLSNRLIKSDLQKDDDKAIILKVYDSFKSYSWTRQNTQDMLQIDVTDKNQAGGRFQSIADNLMVSLSEHKGRIGKLYFTQAVDDRFYSNLNDLYELADGNSGADYHSYFEYHLENRIKKSTLNEGYVNKVVILTDGYIETSHDYTPCNEELRNFSKSANIGEIKERIRYPIKSKAINLENVDFLICEVNPRSENVDFKILNAYWEQWLENIGYAKQLTFLQKELALNRTLKEIENFIGAKTNIKSNSAKREVIETEFTEENSSSSNISKIKEDLINGNVDLEKSVEEVRKYLSKNGKNKTPEEIIVFQKIRDDALGMLNASKGSKDAIILERAKLYSELIKLCDE